MQLARSSFTLAPLPPPVGILLVLNPDKGEKFISETSNLSIVKIAPKTTNVALEKIDHYDDETARIWKYFFMYTRNAFFRSSRLCDFIFVIVL